MLILGYVITHSDSLWNSNPVWNSDEMGIIYKELDKLTGFYFTDAQEIACKRISCSFEQSFWKIYFVFVCKHILTNIVIFSEEWDL